MCPTCITTSVLAVAGATSTGGLVALIVSKLIGPTGAKRIGLTGQTGGERA